MNYKKRNLQLTTETKQLVLIAQQLVMHLIWRLSPLVEMRFVFQLCFVTAAKVNRISERLK